MHMEDKPSDHDSLQEDEEGNDYTLPEELRQVCHTLRCH